MKLTIGHLYPDLLNLYGDRGNIQCLMRRCQWRGIEAETIAFELGDKIDFSRLDIVLLGGGSDREQMLVCEKLKEIQPDFKKYVEDGGVVIAICGGYQMLGRTISDPHGVENENSLCEPLYPAHCEAISHEPDTIAVERIKRDGALPLRGMELPPRETRRQSHAADENSLREPLRGMELIDTDTTLMPEKMRTQTRGKFENVTGIFSTLSGLEFSGYEIHMGKTTVSTGEHQTPLVQLADGRTDGVQRMEKGSEAPGVYGSYVHGIFDDGDIAVRIVQALADKKRVSWKPEAGGDYHAFKEQQYDKLAQGLREHLDMEYVYSILQESRISS